MIKHLGQISLLKQTPSHGATRPNLYRAQGFISPKSAPTTEQQNAKSVLLPDPADFMSHLCTLDQDSMAQSLPGVPKYSECLPSSDPQPRDLVRCLNFHLRRKVLLRCPSTPKMSADPLICTFAVLCPLRLPIIAPDVGHSL